MENSLFNKNPEGIEADQIWVDKKLHEDKQFHPMRRVKVMSVDDTGMVVLASAFFGPGVNDRRVSPATLQSEYELWDGEELDDTTRKISTPRKR